MKRCGRCKTEKPEKDYYKNTRSKDGFSGHCRSCSALVLRAWRARHPLISVYDGMMARCYAPTSHSFINYGARGIRVCDQWRYNFPAFEAWAMAVGYLPGLQLDRTNNDGDYSPDNCRFVTPAENHRNKRPPVKLAKLIQALSAKRIAPQNDNP